MSENSSDDARRARLRAEYGARMHRVIDHIQAHLAEELHLTTLAKVANFSPYHFHRVFGAFVGETLAQFIARLRAERAATKLSQNPNQSITEVALDCGYSSSATFSRAFRNAFGVSPSEWRNGDRKLSKTASKYGEELGKLGKDSYDVIPQHDPATRQLKWKVVMMKERNTSKLEAEVTVRELPEMHVVYVRHIGPYAGDGQLFQALFGKLMTWAAPRGLIGPEAKMLSVYHDDPSVTDESRLRTDCCITAAPDTVVDGEIGKAIIPGGRYAIAHFEIAMDQYGDAWQSVMGGWLPESGFQPADGPCFELYPWPQEQNPEGKCVVDIHVPVKPL